MKKILEKNDSVINFFPTSFKPRELYWWFLINIQETNNFSLTETVPENKKEETNNHQHLCKANVTWYQNLTKLIKEMFRPISAMNGNAECLNNVSPIKN